MRECLDHENKYNTEAYLQKLLQSGLLGIQKSVSFPPQKNAFFYFPKFLSRTTVDDKRAVDTDDTGEAWKAKLTASFKERRCLMCPPGMLRMDTVYNLVIFCCLRTQALSRSSRIYVLLPAVSFPLKPGTLFLDHKTHPRE